MKHNYLFYHFIAALIIVLVVSGVVYYYSNVEEVCDIPSFECERVEITSEKISFELYSLEPLNQVTIEFNGDNHKCSKHEFDVDETPESCFDGALCIAKEKSIEDYVGKFEFSKCSLRKDAELLLTGQIDDLKNGPHKNLKGTISITRPSIAKISNLLLGMFFLVIGIMLVLAGYLKK